MNARDALEDVRKLEDAGLTGLRALMIAAAEQRILEHQRMLARDPLGAMAAIEVCKIVIEALSGSETLH